MKNVKPAKIFEKKFWTWVFYCIHPFFVTVRHFFISFFYRARVVWWGTWDGFNFKMHQVLWAHGPKRECVFYSSAMPQALFYSAQDVVYSIAAKTSRILMLDGGCPLNEWAAAATKEHEWTVGWGFYATYDVNSETWTKDGNVCMGIKEKTHWEVLDMWLLMNLLPGVWPSFHKEETRQTQIKQKGKEKQWLKMQLLFLVPIATGNLTTREKQAQHSFISHCGTWQMYQCCAVLNIDFSCLFGHRLAAVLLKGQLRQPVFKLKANVMKWKEDIQLGKKKEDKKQMWGYRNVGVSGFKWYAPGGFQTWTVTGGGGSSTEIPVFGQDVLYNQVMKDEVIW